jgi:phage/plasmid-like protein (TIGR03299 family)
MSHEIENMFSVKETPWHNLGVTVQNAPNVQDAIKLAGLDWSVNAEPVYTQLGIQIPDTQALIRSSDQSVLGIVGKRYRPLQNADAFAFFNPFIESGECTLETAGSLRQGKRIWVLASLNKAPIEVTKDDAVRPFLLLSNSHDGTLAVRVGFTPIRVVCANTLSMAHSNKESKLIRVWHSSKTVNTLESIREIVNTTYAEFQATAEQYKLLATKEVNSQDIEKYVRIVFNMGNAESEREKLSQAKLVSRIEELFKHGKGNQGKTYWDLYNAVTEYTSYDSGNLRETKVPLIDKQDTRLNNLWFGQGQLTNQRALETALIQAA